MELEQTIDQLLRERAKQHPDKTYLRFRESSYTYGQVDQLTNCVANYLRDELNVKKGDTVTLLLDNCPEFVFSSFGIIKAGAVEVPINTAHIKSVLEYQLNQSDSKILIVGENYFEEIKGSFKNLINLKTVIVVGDFQKSMDFSVIPFEDLMNGNKEPVEANNQYTDLQSIMFTSGTTGPSKGIMMSHKHSLHFASQWIRATNFKSEDRIYTSLPLFHTIAHRFGLMAALIVGTEVSIDKKFSASNFWNAIRYFDATVAHVIFAMIPILLNKPETDRDKDHNLRCVYIGPSALSDRFEQRFGTKVVEAYGATENGLVTNFEYADFKPGSCGKADKNYYVQLVDDDDKEVVVGEVGEFVVRPKEAFTLFQGYYNMPQETLDSFRNLWFHTGDFGYQDEEGYFYFVDRKKDAIRRRGENISSFEVESIVNAHPAVLECSAIAVPSNVMEDEVKICVVLHEESEVTEKDLFLFCEENMARFMRPRYIEFMKALPKTSNGKVQKIELRKQGKSGITRETWDVESIVSANTQARDVAQSIKI